MIDKHIFENFIYRIKDMREVGFTDEQIKDILGDVISIKDFRLYFDAALNISRRDDIEDVVDYIYSEYDIFEEIKEIKENTYGK